MQVTVKGRYFTKDKRALLTDLSQWCADKMLGKKLSKNVTLTLKIASAKWSKETGFYGITEVHEDDDWNRSRNFVITITSKYEILRSLIIVAHEMVHVKQHAKGELSYCGRTGTPKWNGSKVEEDALDYWDLPWEIEAHGREKGLVYQWVRERGYHTEPWFKELI